MHGFESQDSVVNDAEEYEVSKEHDTDKIINGLKMPSVQRRMLDRTISDDELGETPMLMLEWQEALRETRLLALPTHPFHDQGLGGSQSCSVLVSFYM